MTIISAMPSDKCLNAAAPGQDSVPDFDFGDMSQILYWYVHGCDSATGRGEVAFSSQKYELPGSVSASAPSISSRAAASCPR